MAAGIILAGGLSERFKNNGTPKQFVEVGSIPLTIFSVAAFENCREIDAFTIVAPRERHDMLRKWIDRLGNVKFKVFAMPGKTRQHSIFNGLLALKSRSPRRVVIHDAARPCISDIELSICIHASIAGNADGATPVLPPGGTVYQSADGKTITGLLSRDELVVGLTPECYDYAKYLSAHENMKESELCDIRGSSEIAFRAGMKINTYPGNPSNLKITTVEDLDYFKYLVGKRKPLGLKL